METLFFLYIFCGIIVAGICLPVYHDELQEDHPGESDNLIALIGAVLLAFAIWPYVIYRDIIAEKNIGSRI